MPSFGTVTLVYGSPAVTQNYLPSNLAGGLATNVDRTDSTPSGFGQLTRSTRGPVSGNGVYKVVLKLTDPVVADADTTCSCVGDVLYTDSVEVSFLLSEKSAKADRTALRLKLIQLLGNAATVSQVDDLEYIWA